MAKKEQKIFLDPQDDLGVVIKKIKKEKNPRLVLKVPEDSVLKMSLENFHAIAKEARLEDKEIVIESTDPYIEELANLAKLGSVNPMFGKRENFVSDILPRGNEVNEISNSSEDKDNKKSAKIKISSDPGGEISSDKKAYDFFSHPHKKKKRRSHKGFPITFSRKWLIAMGIIIIILAPILIFKVLPRADITVVLKKADLSFEESVLASSDAYDIDVESSGVDMIIPGELISASQNTQMDFLATGREEVNRKAKGEIYIYNEFSSSPQPLVQNTRFVSPEGKIFRIDKRVTVPGAQVKDGNISPSRIKVSVTADKPGESYNINPDTNEKWTIPGFKEARLMGRYEGFYGMPAGSMEGGSVGVATVPTEEDVENGRSEIRKSLKNSLQAKMKVVNSPKFVFLEKASSFKVSNEEITNPEIDGNHFKIFAVGKMESLAFRKGDLNEALIKKLAPSLDFDVEIVDQEIIYNDVSVDFSEGVMRFVAKGSLTIKPKVDKESIRSQLLGKDETAIRGIVFGIPGLEKAKVSLWPFWVDSVPENPNKVKITFE